MRKSYWQLAISFLLKTRKRELGGFSVWCIKLRKVLTENVLNNFTIFKNQKHNHLDVELTFVKN
jgi:hypothetical protein